MGYSRYRRFKPLKLHSAVKCNHANCTNPNFLVFMSEFHVSTNCTSTILATQPILLRNLKYLVLQLNDYFMYN
jgi:hypothetical protein